MRVRIKTKNLINFIIKTIITHGEGLTESIRTPKYRDSEYLSMILECHLVGNSLRNLQ